MPQLHIIRHVHFNSSRHDCQWYYFSAAIHFPWLNQADSSDRNLSHPIPLGEAEGCYICLAGRVLCHLRGDHGLCWTYHERLSG